MPPNNIPSPLTLKQEILAILLGISGLFVMITQIAPHTTGWIGTQIVNGLLQTLLGQATWALPPALFLTCYFIFKNNRTTFQLILSNIGILSLLSTILSLIQQGELQTWPGTIATETQGGWIGLAFSFMLQKMAGYTGAWLILIGFSWISISILMGFSIQYLLASIKDKLSQTQDWPNTPSPPASAPPSNPNTTPIKPPPIEPEMDLIPDPLPPISIETPKKLSKNTPTLLPKAQENGEFTLPPLELLEPPAPLVGQDNQAKKSKHIENAKILEETLSSFGVQTKVVHITPGPSVTRYELQPGTGVKISKITALNKDIALKLAVVDVRIEAPIPGKALIGIEVPNTDIQTIVMRHLLDNGEFFSHPSKLLCCMGLTITGESVFMDLTKMPHVLIAGATGSGKSVCVNAIILSILLRSTPEEVKFLMIDPKKVELSLYDGIPHLLAPVVTNPHKAAATLKQWALLEMERRYEEFSLVGVKDILGYNKWTEKEEGKSKLPYIVVIIDELADLMMVAAQDVESTICRLAQMSRATGIHLVIATQRPSVNVITGLIKANIPSRISFFLQSQIDSRTILDMPGAEKLLGKGDMLYSPVGAFKPKRVQGIFVSEKEVKHVVTFLKTQGAPQYLEEIISVTPLEGTKSAESNSEDELFEAAKDIVTQTQYASTSYLQRKLRIGYNRAARLMDELQEKGFIPQNGEKRPPS